MPFATSIVTQQTTPIATQQTTSSHEKRGKVTENLREKHIPPNAFTVIYDSEGENIGIMANRKHKKPIPSPLP